MEARNRIISDWYGKIKRAEIKLPRFQRMEAWDRYKICSLVQTVIHNLPLGITLVLDVGDEEKFISRYLATAPESGNRVYEHLLDGQQRLTALWRVFQNNYDWETYYLHVKEFSDYDGYEEIENLSVYWRGRYFKKNGTRYPLWCDDPQQTLQRGMIPTELLRPEESQNQIDGGGKKATENRKPPDGNADALEDYFNFKTRVSDTIRDIRAIVANYNLPYLSLPAQTEKSVALEVFINMNTNSKPLSTYDIIVAEVESVMGQSLHDLESELNDRHPEIATYSALPNLILNTAALLQGKLPNQKGAWDMDKRTMVDHWSVMERGMVRMAAFLLSEGIFDESRLPTNAVLAVIGALYSSIPESGDKLGQDELLLRRYLWHAFFTDRYENSAATNAYSDFNALRSIIEQKSKTDGSPYTLDDVPIFFEHTPVEAEELKTAEWPKRSTIRGRAVLAVVCRLGAQDFSTGQNLTKDNIADRHYHHVYPDALLKEADIQSYLALNCALITDKTNMSIGRKDPLDYLKDRYAWTSEDIVEERLNSHLIPVEQLANGGYENLDDESKHAKLEADFDAFLSARAEIVAKAARLLSEGKKVSWSELN